MPEPSLWQSLRRAFGLARPAQADTASDRRPAAPAEAPFNVDDERIPDASRDRVKRIIGLVGELEQRMEQRGLIGELIEVRRIRSAHLPRLLQSYIDIPPEYRAEVFRETGRSASFLLNERLDKMTERLREISMMLARNNLDAFAANMRFIDTRYDSSSPFD